MPSDSLHPDAKLTHEVLVERWLTQSEYDALAAQRKLGWQTTREQEEANENVEGMEVEEVSFSSLPSEEGRELTKDEQQQKEQEKEQAAESKKEDKKQGIYYTLGSGTPLRSHARLVSSSSRSRPGSPSTPLSSGSSTPRIPGRLPLRSTITASAGWSAKKGTAARLVEEEREAKRERERRRRASVALGGEEEVVESEAETKKAKTEGEGEAQGRIKLAEFGDDGVKVSLR